MRDESANGTTFLRELLARRIVVLDGAMGTIIQRERLGEADYRGEAFREHGRPLLGCSDVLCISRPGLIERIHRDYFAAGADIVETNTFNSTRIVLDDYGLGDRVVDINRAAAQVARRAADAVRAQDPGRVALVAGSMGPTNRTASLSPDVERPSLRNVTFDALREAYYEQVQGLVEGGVDLLLPETTFDTLNLKAALFAIRQYFDDHGVEIPIVASVTILDRSARTLSGQTIEAFFYAIEHADLTAVGMNCALGPREMRPHIEELCRVAPIPVVCYPNAGLPNEMGEYDTTPADMAAVLGEWAASGLVNGLGGCCGTTPDHIREIAGVARRYAPRVPPEPSRLPRWSGLEPYVIYPGSTFTMVGERTNVSGSRRFHRLVAAGRMEEAAGVAREQVTGGANLLDVNMDEGMLDSARAMTDFLNQIAGEPDVARVPVMLDSSRFDVLEAGLKCLQGKGIVNSISLEDGEDELLRRARLVRRYGASVIVMAFDEQGQATGTERRVAICERAYRLLTEKAGLPPWDVVFDPNILAVGTGISEHDGYAVSYIEAVRRIKERCPGALVSGGVSNLSFAFRGLDAVREAMHAVFLYHAIRAGMDMGIVNAGQLAVYDEIPTALLGLVEDLVLNRRPDATERLLAYAAANRDAGGRDAPGREEDWRALPLPARVRHALLEGNAEHIEADMAEALSSGDYASPLAVVEGPLMEAMGVVGDLFGAGRMFLPQVVKSARVMKKAVAYLEPFMDDPAAGTSVSGTGRGSTARRALLAAGGTGGRPPGQASGGPEPDASEPQSRRRRILVATVKGDVHDIGKNIVSVVLRCNGYDVVDLGVMVPAERILDAAEAERCDVVGLSGLITPSLDEMVHVAREMDRRGMAQPLLVGGATTSAKHTAVRIAPGCRRPVVQVRDASRAPGVLSQLLGEGREVFVESHLREQEQVRARHEQQQAAADLCDLAVARSLAMRTDWDQADIPVPPSFGPRSVEVAVADLVDLIDWGPFFRVWELRSSWRKQLADPDVGPRYRELLDDARRLLEELGTGGALRLRGAYGFFPAGSDGDDVVVHDEPSGKERCRLHMLRRQVRQGADAGPQQCLADLVAPVRSGRQDSIGALAVTAGLGMEDVVARFRREHDDYSQILAEALADRLAEAFAEHVHRRMRIEWGFESEGELSPQDLVAERYRGIRPAPGYPACPDHTEKRTLFSLLCATQRTGIRLTEHFAMHPAASVCALVFAHPGARYFAVGRIGRDQVEDYARRKGTSVTEVERWLGPNLAYEPAPASRSRPVE